MKKDTEIEFATSKNEALECFYDAAAMAPSAYQFFSPTFLDAWSIAIAKWLCAGKNVCEIGPGRGGMVLHTAKLCSSPLEYLLIDISKAMLKTVKEELGKIDNHFLQCRYVQWDIESNLPQEVRKKSIDHLVAINVLQDVEAEKSLTNMKKIVKNGGSLRATMISKEVQDDFWQGDPDYDTKNGIWYSSSCYHEENRARPMGFRLVNGIKRPFYRIMQCYTKREIIELFNMCGFEVQRIEPIVYPVDYVIKRWSSKYHFMQLNERQKQLLEEWEGYPDGWSVTAKSLSSG